MFKFAVFSVAALFFVGADTASAQAPESSVSLVHAGIDSYLGASNAPGFRRLTDQFWAGQSTFTPSVAYLRWERPDGRAARLSIGLGEASTAAAPMFRQPIEAWWRQPSGRGRLTMGRFFAPFGAQEWQYEARDGLMWSAEFGHAEVSAALQRDRSADRGHLYVRTGMTFGDEAAVGVSLARGQGFSYGSEYDFGYGVDGSVPLGAWTLRGEADRFHGLEGARFRFAMASLSFGGWRDVEPYVSRYDWSDSSAVQELGSFRSTIVGANWRATPWLSVEMALARAGGRRVAWAQLHLSWER